MMPYPTTDLAPVDALRALRAIRSYKDVTRERMLGRFTWAALVAVWNSKRNAVARETYDVQAWASLVHELTVPRSFDVVTKTARLSPVVATIEARIQAGQLDAPIVISLLAEARACKPTSWGSVLGKWRQVVAAASEAA